MSHGFVRIKVADGQFFLVADGPFFAAGLFFNPFFPDIFAMCGMTRLQQLPWILSKIHAIITQI